MSPSRRLAPQRGASLFSMLVLAIIVGFFALMAIRAFPSVNEYLTIRHAVQKIMRSDPGSAEAIRNAFEKTSEVEYSIKTITEKDLKIEQVGDHLRTSFAYDVQIPIVEPVFLLIKYEGSASSGGG